jgi:lytic murein transglycosylase
MRRAIVLTAAFAAALLPAPDGARADATFTRWLQSLWPQAQSLGVSRKTFDTATAGLAPDYALPDLVLPGRAERAPDQPEFVQTPADYLKESSLVRLAEHGRKLAAEHRATLSRIEREFGVPGPMVLAIFGRETDYGRYRLAHDALRVLATQGYAGRRKEMFAQEFLYALKMVEDGLARPAAMKSSWGGALGLTQFLPSEFYKYAVDYDGDGRADIFASVPDALASAAKQLAGKGWQRGKPWAYEVRVPANFDCTLGVPEIVKSIRQWLQDGVAPLGPRQPGAGEHSDQASLLQPEGSYGPAFLTTRNYFVLKDYNFSDLYVLFVGNLADRIAGGGAFRQPWSKTSQMRTAQVEEMQRLMAARSLYADKIDGKAGMKTRSALGAYQKANGLRADCWPGEPVLQHMRRASGRK